MIGTIWGLSLLVSYISQSWSGSDSIAGFAPTIGFIVGSTLIGLIFFPRTVGMALSTLFMGTPVAFVISLFRHSFGYSFAILAVGLAAGAAQMAIAAVRRDAI